MSREHRLGRNELLLSDIMARKMIQDKYIEDEVDRELRIWPCSILPSEKADNRAEIRAERRL